MAPGESYTGYFFDLIIRAHYPSFEETYLPITTVVYDGRAFSTNHIIPQPFTLRWTSVVPEPASMVALGIGLLAVIAKRRKK